MTELLAARPDVRSSRPLGAVRGAAAGVNPVVRMALYVFVASIPFEAPNRTIPLEVPTLTALILLIATALNPNAAYRRIPAAGIWFMVYLWVLTIAIVADGVTHVGLAVKLAVTMLQLILVFWVIYNLLADARVTRGVLLSLVAGCAARATLQVLGVGATAHEVYTGGERVTALGQNPNLSAMILTAGLVATVGLRGRGERGLPGLGLLAGPVALVIGVAIIHGGSRGGLVGAVVGTAAFMVRGPSIWHRVRNAFVGALAGGLLAWGAFHSPMMRNRIEVAEEGQLSGRERIYPALIDMFAARPVMGWGPIDNQFEIAQRIGELKKGRRDAHNLVLELLTATGVVGAVPFLIAFGLCVHAGWRARRGPLGMIPSAMLAGVGVGIVTGTWIASKILWLALAVALAAGHHWSDPDRSLTEAA